MDLSIVIVSWNVKDLLRQNLKSVFLNTKKINFEVFVVDNDSSDGSARMVAREFPKVNLISNNYNAGFAKANNQAIKRALGRYVLLLNPDMRVREGTLDGMVEWMDGHPKAGVAGCRLVNEQNKTLPHVRRFPKLTDQALILLKIPHLFPRVLDGYLAKDFDYGKEQPVDSIRGSFFMIRKKVLEKIGCLDERYFIWFEEVDYCKMAKDAGWEVMYTPCVQCLDFVGKSFGQVRKYKTQKMFTESMLKYFWKWQPAHQYFLLAALRPFGLALAFINEQFDKQTESNK